MGDGWMPNYGTAAEAGPKLEKLDTYLQEAGRSLKDVGLEPRAHYGKGNSDIWQRTIKEWQELGATHLSINTMGCGFKSPV